MDKVYNHKETEEKHYKSWEEKGYFKPENRFGNKDKYSIILPPPNANAPLHFGHAMYVIEDILIRFRRMKGESTLWLPGADHAGFETQFVFEKKLQEEGKSRFDYDRETLYKMIWDFVQGNRPVMEAQLKRLGFSLDWSKKKFTLDEDIIEIVYGTFKNLFDDGLIYREKRLVNYCTFDGTSFSDLEVLYEERKNPLFYIKYGPLVLATTRPETKFGDTAIAVNPQDQRYKKYVGKEIEIETVLGKAKIKVIADKMVDPKFGTGVVKITPAHDFEDYEVSKRHNLPMVQVIGFDGKMNEKAGKFEGLYVRQARKAVVEEMQKKGLIEKIDENYTHRIGLCYKCKNPIEPLPLEQWFIKMEPLAKSAVDAVKKGKIKIFPKNMEKMYFQFLENIRDWNISRQIVWGIRIPAWNCKDCGEWTVTKGDIPEKCGKCSGNNLTQDNDTFDTWFSSGQWPYATLKTTNSLDFYPTTVMETGYDILRWWVARMVMLGLYMGKKRGIEKIEQQVPFENVVLHGLVNDPLGKKMSKSKGNVVNPLELVDEYGADAVRFALTYGTALGNDQSLSYPKLQAMRNFTNKLWNMARFIEINYPDGFESEETKVKNEKDKEMLEKINNLASEVTRLLEKYDFNHAAQNLYEFTWHEFADIYIEDVKNRIDLSSFSVLLSSFLVILKLLHPFMPFVTEEIYQRLWKEGKSLVISEWPSYE
ncbi:MAG TPA: valine--tRNA ligase [Candidatus Sulfotelmatobacter sp.]|nr:valine--tRNA ligase [Candidatus Sulfotelmatobacter sp.]